MKKILAVLLCAVLLLGMAPIPPPAPQTARLAFAVIADTHYFTRELTGDFNEAFRSYQSPGRMHQQVEAILDATLAAIAADAQRRGTRYVFLAGDITREGEVESHRAIAARLERFVDETGIQVLVVPGNHDVNTDRGVTFADGTRQLTACVTPQQFREIYANLGFELPNAEHFIPRRGNGGGSLSYAVDLGENGEFRLIALDTNKFTADQNPAGDTYHSGGMVGDDLLAWAVAQTEQAVARGQTVLGLAHHSLVKHLPLHNRIFRDFVIDDNERVAETLADAGMHFFFSGHTHLNAIGREISDSGNVIYCISTGAMAAFPATFRQVQVTARGQQDITLRTTVHDVDEHSRIVRVDGGYYASPFRVTSLGLTFAEDGIAAMAVSFLSNQVMQIYRGGGLRAMLEGMGLQATLRSALPLGLGRNAVSLIFDLADQIDYHYFGDPQRLTDMLTEMITRLFALQVSQHPSTRFNRPYGIGNPNRPGTFGDLAGEVVIYYYTRTPGVAQNRFVMDAIRNVEQGRVTNDIIELLLQILLQELLQDEFLSTLQLNVASTFNTRTMRTMFGFASDVLLRNLTDGEPSLLAVIGLAFGLLNRLDVLPYTDLNELADSLIDELLTDELAELISYTLADVIRGFVMGNNPDTPDLNATLRITGPRAVPATIGNLRLPANLHQQLPAADEDFDRAIAWTTRYSVTGTDVRVFNAAGENITNTLEINRARELVPHDLPGIDFGMMAMRDLEGRRVNSHRVEISGLAAGETYSYQVGCARRGWWSPRGSITMPSDDTTVLIFANQQAMTRQQYQRHWGGLARAAPPADLAVMTTLPVHNPQNTDQWQWFYAAGQPLLRRTPLLTQGAVQVGDVLVLLLDADDISNSSVRRQIRAAGAAHVLVVSHEEIPSRTATQLQRNGVDLLISTYNYTNACMGTVMVVDGQLVYSGME